MGSRITNVVTDLTQGPLQNTGNPLDVALDGPGFLAVADRLGRALHARRPARRSTAAAG